MNNNMNINTNFRLKSPKNTINSPKSITTSARISSAVSKVKKKTKNQLLLKANPLYQS